MEKRNRFRKALENDNGRHTAMDEFLSRGGRIKKIKMADTRVPRKQSFQHNENDSLFGDFSSIEGINPMRFKPNYRRNDFE